MVVIDRLVRHLPSHPHPPKLKEIPQITGVPVPFGLTTAPEVFTMIAQSQEEERVNRDRTHMLKCFRSWTTNII